MQLDTSLKIIAVAVITYGLLQFTKRYFPGLCGKHAVALNLLYTVVGTVLSARPTSWGATIAIILQTAGVSAGIHGTIKTLTKDQDADGVKTPAGGTVAALALALLLFPLAGCAHRVTAAAPAPLPVGAVDQIDATSNRVLQAAHGFANRVTVDVMSGKVQLSAGQRSAMGKLNSVLNIADKMEIDYHECGLARAAQPSLAACEAGNLTSYVTMVQTAFSDATLTFAPTPAHK